MDSKKLSKKLDAFPTQLVLTLIWGTVGLVICIILKSSLLWVILMSWYAIVVSHFSAHLAWRAKRSADEAAEEVDNKTTDKKR